MRDYFRELYGDNAFDDDDDEDEDRTLRAGEFIRVALVLMDSASIQRSPRFAAQCSRSEGYRCLSR
jgi:hypothetical protein